MATLRELKEALEEADRTGSLDVLQQFKHSNGQPRKLTDDEVKALTSYFTLRTPDVQPSLWLRLQVGATLARAMSTHETNATAFWLSCEEEMVQCIEVIRDLQYAMKLAAGALIRICDGQKCVEEAITANFPGSTSFPADAGNAEWLRNLRNWLQTLLKAGKVKLANQRGFSAGVVTIRHKIHVSECCLFEDNYMIFCLPEVGAEVFEYRRQEAKHVTRLLVEAHDGREHRLSVTFRPNDEPSEAHFYYASKEEALNAGRMIVTWLRKGKDLCGAELLSWLRTDEGRAFHVTVAISQTLALPGNDEEDPEDPSEIEGHEPSSAGVHHHSVPIKLKDRMRTLREPVTRVQDSFAISDADDPETQDLAEGSKTADRCSKLPDTGADSNRKPAISPSVAIKSAKAKPSTSQSANKAKQASANKKGTLSAKSSKQSAARPLKTIKKTHKASKAAGSDDVHDEISVYDFTSESDESDEEDVSDWGNGGRKHRGQAGSAKRKAKDGEASPSRNSKKRKNVAPKPRSRNSAVISKKEAVAKQAILERTKRSAYLRTSPPEVELVVDEAIAKKPALIDFGQSGPKNQGISPLRPYRSAKRLEFQSERDEEEAAATHEDMAASVHSQVDEMPPYEIAADVDEHTLEPIDLTGIPSPIAIPSPPPLPDTLRQRSPTAAMSTQTLKNTVAILGSRKPVDAADDSLEAMRFIVEVADAEMLSLKAPNTTLGTTTSKAPVEQKPKEPTLPTLPANDTIRDIAAAQLKLGASHEPSTSLTKLQKGQLDRQDLDVPVHTYDNMQQRPDSHTADVLKAAVWSDPIDPQLDPLPRTIHTATLAAHPTVGMTTDPATELATEPVTSRFEEELRGLMEANEATNMTDEVDQSLTLIDQEENSDKSTAVAEETSDSSSEGTGGDAPDEHEIASTQDHIDEMEWESAIDEVNTLRETLHKISQELISTLAGTSEAVTGLATSYRTDGKRLLSALDKSHAEQYHKTLPKLESMGHEHQRRLEAIVDAQACELKTLEAEDPAASWEVYNRRCETQLKDITLLIKALE